VALLLPNLLPMLNAPVIPPEYAVGFRRAVAKQAVQNIRAKGIEPAPVVLEWLAAYSRAQISHAQLLHLM
jgi:hypothetical protein